MRQERTPPIGGWVRIGRPLAVSGMPGVEDVSINELGTENEMTSTSSEQNRALVLKIFELQQAVMTPAERFWS